MEAIGRVYRKCRAINPDFCLAGEAAHDRLIPYIDVYYRSAGGYNIAPLRYAFPEWTTCLHVGAPRDFNGVNAAVMLGAVICVEPQTYQASLANPLYDELARYIAETERIRGELRDTIFDADYFDTLDATVSEVSAVSDSSSSGPAASVGGEFIIPGGASKFQPMHSGAIHFRVHGNRRTRERAIVVINTSTQPRVYKWEFAHRQVEGARLYEPFQAVREVSRTDAVRIKPERFHILVEKRQ